MSKDTPYQIDRDAIRANLNKYTRQAYAMLPELDEPRILDIGCGSGVPTIELARLSNGEIIGLDIDKTELDKLAGKLESQGLTDRIRIVECSIAKLDFPNGSFDIIWAEGSVSAIGFRKGLEEWRQFLKPNGFLVVHDDIRNIEKKLDQVSICGYELLGRFILSDEVWWNEYYAPLDRRIEELRNQHVDDPNLLTLLEKEQKEINVFKKNPRRYQSVFIVMRKGRRVRQQLRADA
ncbi:MAG: class I SAM-dependent methyltransferase [Candidatus Zixiibacteriota bacterium]